MAPNTQRPPNIFEDAPRSPTKPSVIRAILSAKSHKRNLSADEAIVPKPFNRNTPLNNSFESSVDGQNQHYQQPLSEITANRDAGDGPPKSPTKSDGIGLHKKTKSVVSLKSLISYMERKDNKTEDLPDEESQEWKPKKAKSANSLTAILKRSQRGRKNSTASSKDNKENRSPSDSLPSPVWTQYTARSSLEQPAPRRSQDTRRTLHDEVSLYTPRGYGPQEQRNFYDFHQPSLTKRTEPKPRPKSEILTGNRKMKEVLSAMRTPSDNAYPTNAPEPSSPTKPQGRPRRFSRPRSRSRSRSGIEQKSEQKPEQKPESNPQKISRVQAAISAFNAKEQGADLHRMSVKELESEFEKLLDARNTPHNMRDKMRSLDTNIKIDFILKDRSESAAPSSANPGADTTDSSRRGRKKEQKDDQTRDGKSRSRSRSRGWSFKGSISPTKKRSGSGSSHRRPKSADFSQPATLANILTPTTSVTSLAMTANHDTAIDPSDFVHYLREIQKPEMVEVGKVHKLRLLLRNETITWVDTFIADGGMDEIVQLLYRIMKVEWREEHEDNLLHETLLCMKALCTTSVALKRLTDIESELFPALLKMLFDEEKKGPSEFTTRQIIINLLFTQLDTASSNNDATTRASRLLSYLRDPTPPEENQPLNFIANIYQSRPYRIWCKEVTNVAKEVFWIFLHHLNVIPIVKSDDTSSAYRERHFPVPRPPVPAAPYVGGVEWDATNYLAAHLDLLNGLIASMPTREERNNLRDEFRASGFEKVMGGSLRTCKEKFYSSIHDCLRTWISAAMEDEWPYTFIREGPPRPEPSKSPIKTTGGSPNKGIIAEKPPQLELPLPLPIGNNDNRRFSPKGDINNWL